MAKTVTSNMNLTLPEVSVTAGPEWASDLNTMAGVIDTHDHTSGKGVPVPTSGINVNANLPFNGYRATSLAGAIFQQQATLSTTVNQLQVGTDGEIYFRDGAGNSVKMTSGGSINVAGSGGFTGDYITASAEARYTNSTSLYEFYNGGASALADIGAKGILATGRQTRSVAAVSSNTAISASDAYHIILVTTSGGAVTLTLPDPTGGKRHLIVKDTGHAGQNNITLARFGSENIEGVAGNYTLDISGGTWNIVSDGTNWFVIGPRTPSRGRFAITNSSVAPFSTYAAIPIASTTYLNGDCFTRSGNVFTFARKGRYVVELIYDGIVCGGATDVTYWFARVQDTSTPATIITSKQNFVTAQNITTGQAGRSNGICRMEFEITDTTRNYEIQWAEQGVNYSVVLQYDMDLYINQVGQV